MTSPELSAWTCLATTVLVWGTYFLWIAGGPHAGAVVSMALAVAIGAHALLTGIARAFARRDRNCAADERDAAIGVRACRNAYWVLLVAVGLLVFSPAALLAGAGAVSAVLLASLVAAELVRFASQIPAYRRGV